MKYSKIPCWLMICAFAQSTGRADAQDIRADLTPSTFVWAAHLEHQVQKDASQLVKAPIIEFATNLYRNKPNLDPTVVLHILNKADAAYQVKFEGTYMRDSDSRAAIAGLLIDAAAGTANVGTVLRHAGPLLRQPFTNIEAFEQGLAAKVVGVPNQTMMFDRPCAEYARLHVFQQAAMEAEQNKNFRMVLNAYVSKLANGVKVEDTPLIIQQKSPEFGRNDRVQKALALLDKVGKVRDVEIARLRTEMKSAKVAILENKKELERVFVYLKKYGPRVTPEEINRQIQREFGDAKVEVYLMSSLVGFRDPKLGNHIATVGNAGIQIAESIAQRTAGTITSAALTGNIFAAASSVASLFLKGPTPEELILEQIKEVRKDILELRKDVAQLRKEMHERFDRIEDLMNANFSILFRELGYLQEDVREIKEFLSQINYNVNSLSSDMRNYHLELSRRDLIKLLDIAADRSNLKPLGEEKYQDCVRDLRLWATKFARQTVETGFADELRTRELGDPLLYQTVLKRLRGRPLQDNIGLLAEISQKLGHTGMSLDIPNPVTWANCANAYVELSGRQWSAGNKSTRIEDTQAILDEGERLQAGLASLSRGKEGHKLLTGLIRMYESRVDIFEQVANQRRKRYMDDNVMGLDLWLDAHQEPNPKNEKAEVAFPVLRRKMEPIERLEEKNKPEGIKSKYSALFGSALSDYNQQLEPPTGVERIIPREFLIAERLGLGEVTLKWDNRRAKLDAGPGEFEVRKYSMLVQCTFVSTGSVLDVFTYERSSIIRVPASKGRRDVRFPLDFGDYGRWEQRYKSYDGWMGHFLGKRVLEMPNVPGFKPLPVVKDLFVNEARSGIDDKTAKKQVEAIVPMVTKELERRSKDLAGSLTNSLRRKDDLELFAAVQQVESARLLLTAYIAMAFPNSLEDNDKLRSLLFGTEAVLGERALSSDTVNLHAPELLTTMRARTKNLHSLLDEDDNKRWTPSTPYVYRRVAWEVTRSEKPAGSKRVGERRQVTRR